MENLFVFIESRPQLVLVSHAEYLDEDSFVGSDFPGWDRPLGGRCEYEEVVLLAGIVELSSLGLGQVLVDDPVMTLVS